MASSHRDIYISGLVNAHGLERQAIQLINRQLDRLENYPDLAQRLRQHHEETERQTNRLEQILDGLGTTHSTLKDMGMAFMGNLAAIGHAMAQDEVVKNSLANFAFENYEIATYRSLLTMADLAGDMRSTRLLQESLDEEQAMARWIEEHLDSTVRTYMEREVSGQTAGV